MKKSLIALAVAGVFAAPAAMAATSNVDIYGKLHVSINFMDDQDIDAEDIQVTSNASRIGFKGSEDLGGGLKGVWQIESGVDLDEQTGGLGSRNSFLGLSGGFGTALIGNHDTPLKLVGRAVDLFGDSFADSRNVMGGGSDGRAKNVVAYISPDFSGFSVAAAYTNDFGGSTADTGSGKTGAQNGDGPDQSAYNLSATYKNGPLFVGVGYGDGDYHEANDLGAHWRVAGSYAFGDLKVVAQYDQLDGNLSTDADYDAWMVGAAYAMGPITLKANFMEGDVSGTSDDPTQWTIGADYALSKRTSAYVNYTSAEHTCLGCGGGNSDRVGHETDDISSLSVGVVHNF